MPRDLCKGPRELYGVVLKTLVIHPVLAGVLMGLPTYFLAIIAIIKSIAIFRSEFMFIQTAATTGPFYTLLGFTVVAWAIEIASIKFVLPNVLHFCGFCHSAIGSWWLVNLFIIFFAGWTYIPVGYMFPVLISAFVPAVIWHITADIIRAYRLQIIEGLLAPQPLAQQVDAV